MTGRRVVSGSERGGRRSDASGRDGHAGRVARSVAHAVPESADGRPHATGRQVRSGGDAPFDMSQRQSNPGEFVDARRLDGEDIVARTLEETSGTLGVAMRPKVVDFKARLKERRRANVRTIAIRAGVAVAAAAALGALVWLLFFSSVFRLETWGISVSGANEWVSEDQIMQIASQQAGKSLLLVSGDDVVDQLNDIPGVTRAEVEKEFPNELSVTVEAQKPAAMLQTPDGTLTAVDSKGRVLNSVDGVSVEGIPVIAVDSVDEGTDSKAVLEAVKILASLSDAMRGRINAVSAATQDSITTQLDGGNYTVVWGDASDLKLKMAVVDKILNDPNVIGDKHQVDVSAPLRPIIK